jgi:hypothetical protein
MVAMASRSCAATASIARSLLVESSRIAMRRPRRVCSWDEALVGGDEQMNLLSECEQFAVLYAFPTDLLRGVALMTGEQFAQRRRDAFVEQYLHAG